MFPRDLTLSTVYNELCREHRNHKKTLYIHDHRENLCIAVLSTIPLCKTFYFFLRRLFLFKELAKIFKDFCGKFKDFSRISYNFSVFKDFSRPVRTKRLYWNYCLRGPCIICFWLCAKEVFNVQLWIYIVDLRTKLKFMGSRQVSLFFL